MSDIDWPALMPAVAERLLGEATRRTRTERRYGAHGSLKIDLKKGAWTNFETGEGGGVLDLVRQELACDQDGAWDWLRSEGLVPGHPRRPAARQPASAPSRPRQLGPDLSARRRRTVRLLMRASVPDPGHAREYLASRGVWDPSRPLPKAVRWIDRSAISIVPWADFPDTASGAMVLALTGMDNRAKSLQLEALAARDGAPAGRTSPRWRRTRGAMGTSVVRVPGPATGPLALCEGPTDALAVRTWVGCEAWAACSASRMPGLATRLVAEGRTGRPISVYADGGSAGRRAAQAVADLVRTAGVSCTLHWASGEEADPAEDLSRDWLSCAMSLEQSGCERAEARRQAWKQTKRKAA